MLSDSQLRLIAETLSNVGLLFFGSMVVPVFAGSDMLPEGLITGLLFSLVFWFTSLFIIKHTKP